VEFEPKHGDMLELEGEWKASTHASSLGRLEFCFKTAMLNVPQDSRALLHYAATLTKGIGPVKETEIWERFGEQWQTGDITGIQGINETVAWNWTETLRRLGEHAAQTQAITLLLSKGATLNMANAAWERWKTDTVGTVTANCYRLTDLPHYGFADVDENIRVAFGIDDEDPRRVEAALMYVIEQATGSGDTVVPMTIANGKVCEMVQGANGKLDAALKVLVDRGDVVVLAAGMLALAGDAQAEKLTWERFRRGG
jgi:exodeoxyribonuclease V alpha subunit